MGEGLPEGEQLFPRGKALVVVEPFKAIKPRRRRRFRRGIYCRPLQPEL